MLVAEVCRTHLGPLGEDEVWPSIVDKANPTSPYTFPFWKAQESDIWIFQRCPGAATNHTALWHAEVRKIALEMLLLIRKVTFGDDNFRLTFFLTHAWSLEPRIRMARAGGKQCARNASPDQAHVGRHAVAHGWHYRLPMMTSRGVIAYIMTSSAFLQFSPGARNSKALFQPFFLH